MVEITTATVANSSERAAATSYLWGQTSTGPIVERLFAATDFMTKNANSHYQIGTTSLSWFSNAKALQVGNGAVWGVEASNANEIEIGSNYYQSVAGTYKYSATGKARLIRLRDTEMGFYRAAAGSAAGTITWLQDVTIDDSGNVLVKGVGCLGYGTGAGGTVTQATSRTTGVTLSKSCGAITLVSAAGSTSWQSFTVTNTLVAATDVVHVCQKSGTDLYEIHVTNVAAGSFKVSFKTTSGTTTEQPVFNFTVLKAVTS
jgi:hypothetical protein